MKVFSCPRNAELARTLKAGHLRAAWEPSLRKHVDECRHCSDFLLISETLRPAREEAMRSAPVLSPGLLWWRAQLRRRNRAIQQISRPTSIFGRVGLISTFLVAVVALIVQRQQSAEWLRWLFGLHDTAVHSAVVAQISIWNLLLGIVTLGAIVLMGAFAVFLASDRS